MTLLKDSLMLFFPHFPPTIPIQWTALELDTAKKLQVLRQKRSMLLAETLTAVGGEDSDSVGSWSKNQTFGPNSFSAIK